MNALIIYSYIFAIIFLIIACVNKNLDELVLAIIWLIVIACIDTNQYESTKYKQQQTEVIHEYNSNDSCSCNCANTNQYEQTEYKQQQTEVIHEYNSNDSCSCNCANTNL